MLLEHTVDLRGHVTLEVVKADETILFEDVLGGRVSSCHDGAIQVSRHLMNSKCTKEANSPMIKLLHVIKWGQFVLEVVSGEKL